VSEVRTITADVARRYLAIHHFLAPPRSLQPGSASVRAVFDRLGSLQFDPIDYSGRNHDLALLARIDGYRRSWTDGLLYDDRVLYETYNKGLSLVPTAELPWYRITWDLNRARHEGGTFDEHAPLVEELLGRIRATGPMSSTDVEPRAAIDWYWRPTNQVRAIFEALAEAGILGLARRDGNRRVYDLSERLFPADLLARRPAYEEQRRHKLLSRYRAHGLLGAVGSAELWHGTAADAAERKLRRTELVEAGAILEVGVEGVRGPRYLPATALDRLDGPSGRSPPTSLPEAGRRASPSSPPSTRSPGIGTCSAACTASTTSGRSTSRLRSAGSATTSCRSNSAIGSSVGSSRD
jgi:uncharacterized protein YcaQ